MTKCRKCGSTTLAGQLQCRCVQRGNVHTVSSFVRAHPRHQAQQTHGRLERLWRRHWTMLGLPLIAIGWVSLAALHRTTIGNQGVGLIFSPLFFAIVLAVGVGLPVCKQDTKRGYRLRGWTGMFLGYALGAAAAILLFTRVLSLDPFMKM